MVANGLVGLVHRPLLAAEHEQHQRRRHNRIPTPSSTPNKKNNGSLPLVYPRTHNYTYTVLHEPEAGTGRLLQPHPPQDGHLHPEHQLRRLSTNPRSLRNARDPRRPDQDPPPHKYHDSRANSFAYNQPRPHPAYHKHPRPDILIASHRPSHHPIQHEPHTYVTTRRKASHAGLTTK